MFKTRLTINKELMVSICALCGMVFLMLVNIVIIVPALFSVYKIDISTKVEEPIDAQTLNEALKLLSP